MTEFRPPDGTPDGTVCWLERKPGEFLALRWGEVLRDAYWFAGYASQSPRVLHHNGWRFHSIAKPPEG